MPKPMEELDPSCQLHEKISKNLLENLTLELENPLYCQILLKQTLLTVGFLEFRQIFEIFKVKKVTIFL